MAVSGPAVGLASVGGLLIYAAITDQSPIQAIRDLTSGKTIPPAPFTKPVVNAGGLGEVGGGDFPAAGSGLLGAAQKYLGRRYQWGGTFAGDKGGDCSGLVWRAGKDNGVNWPRFTTTTILLSSYVQRVPSPSTGDIVVWPGLHMGIVSAPGQMIAAPRTGDVVKYSSFTPMRSGRMAVYLRLKSSAGFNQKRGI